MGARRQGRECALQLLYQLESHTEGDLEQALRLYFTHLVDSSERAIDAETSAYAEQLVRGVSEHLAEIDRWLSRCSQHWRVERMSRVDRNLLRLAVYELLYQADVPTSVVLDEAIEIAKRFGNEESPSFVNGLLNRVAQECRGRAP